MGKKAPNPKKLDCTKCNSTIGCTCIGACTDYKEEYVQKAYDYLQECKDSYENDVETYDEDSGHSTYRKRLKVKLPTLQGFAHYIGHCYNSLQDWKKLYKPFSIALDAITQEQHRRLLDSGLSGEYNPTIAKLILSNNHGYAEKKETKLSGGIRIEDLTE